MGCPLCKSLSHIHCTVALESQHKVKGIDVKISTLTLSLDRGVNSSHLLQRFGCSEEFVATMSGGTVSHECFTLWSNYVWLRHRGVCSWPVPCVAPEGGVSDHRVPKKEGSKIIMSVPAT